MRVEREGGRREINPSVKFDGGLLIRLSLYADFDSVDHCRSIGPGNCCWVNLDLGGTVLALGQIRDLAGLMSVS